jgi:hypothetical protein
MNQITFAFAAKSQPPVAVLRTAGELRKECGMQLAADARAEAVAAGQVAFLSALIKSPDRTATIDDGTGDLAATFSDGGKWRGTVVRSLALARIIERVDVVKSDRPSRHRGFVSRWRLLDPDRARRKLESLSAWLTAVKENPQTGATAAGMESKSTTPEQEGTSDATN